MNALPPKALKVAATVVTRNRPQCLATVLDLLSRQTLAPDTILVVDNNSEPATRDVVAAWENQCSRIKYVNTGRNAGSAGGQKAAFDYAVRHGFDLVFTMDDDCEPQLDSLNSIIAAWQALPDRERWALNSVVMDTREHDLMSFGLWDGGQIGVRLPSVFYRRLGEIPAGRTARGIFEGWGAFFNGTLLPTSLIREVGLPREELFIRGDEADYFFRILRSARVGTALESVVRHPKEETVTPGMPPWKVYYSTRNAVLVHREYFPSIKTSHFWLLMQMVKFWLAGIAGRNPSVNRARALAVWDAACSRFGRDAFALR